MNTDGLEGRDTKEQQQCNEEKGVEQQQQQVENDFFRESTSNEEDDATEEGIAAAESGCGGEEHGSMAGSEDVVMEMPTNFPDWSGTGGGGGGNVVAMRRVSFPNDKELVTGYMEPADPWANVKSAYSANELLDLYRESCQKHQVSPLIRLVEQLDGLQVPIERSSRLPQLHLNDQVLTIAQCESLEEVLKRVRYKSIDVSGCHLDDTTATALFDMIEYYEATNELDISNNPRIEQRGLQACANMIKRCCSLLALYAHRIPMSEQSAKVISNAMLSSPIHTLKLEYCKLSGRPIGTLCAGLIKNEVLKELWLAGNELSDYDAFSIAGLLKSNFYLQYLDISNNKIQDNGVSHIVLALIKQSQYFKNQVTSLLPVAASDCQGQGSGGVYVKKPRSPVVEDMVKDVNDNIKNGGESPPSSSSSSSTSSSSSEEEKNGLCEQWDFLSGDSNNNSNNNNKNNNETTAAERSPDKKMDLIAEERGEGALSPVEDIDDNGGGGGCGSVTVHADNKEHSEQKMDFETSPLGSSSPSAAIDINCNICITDNNRDAGQMVVGSETSSTSPSSSSLVKDLIDFDDSPKHRAKDEEESSVTTTAATEQVGMFKLDEEEESGDRNTNENDNNKSGGGQSMNFLQMPDSPASTVSQHSTDADSGCEAYPNHDGSFSTPPPSSLAKRFKLSASDEDPPTTPLKSERSLSSESLNSEASMESNDSKSSIRIMSNRFSKNGTLERQTSNSSIVAEKQPQTAVSTGLQVLVLWNNLLTKKCSQAISDMIKETSTLEVLNVGKNSLGSDFVSAIKASLCANDSISKLGLQSVQLTCAGAKTVAEVIEAKCGSPLTRVDLRDNKIQVAGLTALHEAVKCNKSITQIDLNATPIDASAAAGGGGEDPNPESEERLKLVRSIRDQCLLNESPPEPITNSGSSSSGGGSGTASGKHKSTTRSRFVGVHKSSRKISLTCQSVKPEFLVPAPPIVKGSAQALLDPARKSSGRLKSPLPSPIPSPVPSPIPSPSRSRFQVSRVKESASLSPLTPPSSASSSPTNSMSRFRVTTVPETKSTASSSIVVARSQAMTIPNSSGSSISSSSFNNNISAAGNNNHHPHYHHHLTKSVTVLSSSSPGNCYTTRPAVLVHSQHSESKQENVFFGSTPPQVEMLRGDCGGGGSGSRVKSSREERDNKRLQSVSLDTISSSLDSPDLEVKRIMMLDDSSSIGSLDSYNTQLAAGSLSSTESIDVVAKDPPAASAYQLNVNMDCKMSLDSSVESISERCNNLVLQEPPLVHVKRSSELVVADSGGMPSASSSPSEGVTKAAATAPRTRKTSWIPANQATIDKLMSIFQNPFSRQCSPNDGHGEERATVAGQSATVVVAATAPEQSSNVVSGGGGGATATRKENSLGNLFNWAASGMKREDKEKSSAERLTDDSQSTAMATTAKQSVLIPANSRGESNNNNISNKDVVANNGPDVIQLSADVVMTDSQMNEIKENISPEHTITASTVQQQQQQQQQQMRSPIPLGDNEKCELVRVKFKLGSTEDFDELLAAEDEELLEAEDSPGRGANSGSTGLTSDDSCLSLDVENGIGQIARDSMVIFNTSGGSSSSAGGGGGGTVVKTSSPVTSKAD